MSTSSPNDSTSEYPGVDDQRWSARLRQASWIIAATALVFLALVIAHQLSALVAILGFVIILAAIMVLPLGLPTGYSGEALDSAAVSGRSVALRRFADALSEPCILVDVKSNVVHANAVALSQFPNLRNGAPMALALRYPALIEAVNGVIATGENRQVELHQTAPAENWYQVTAGALYASGEVDRPHMVVVVLQMLTEQKRVEQMRADFVANASHEMRTPLTSLIGFVDTMMGPAEQDKESSRRFLGIMRGQAERLSKLIDDLLSLSRIELHQHVRPTSRVDLGVLLAEVAEGLQTQAQEAGTKLTLELPEGKAIVSGERNELYEVFENLMDNALKYGAENSEVLVSLLPCEGKPDLDFAVLVKDEGEGIAEEHVPRLTERFYRIDAESSRKKKGTGLGLSIVKHIVQRHRGTLTISSKPGDGTSVEVLLPR